MSRTRILLADDHAVVVESLDLYLRQWFDVVAVVRDGLQLIDAVHKYHPDLVIADIGMPKMNGLEALRRLKAARLSVKVIFLTMYTDVALAAEALRDGAMGYVLKNAAGEELHTAVRQVLQGMVYLPAQIGEQVISALSMASTTTVDRLTPRQRDVLPLIAAGRTVKEIAGILGLSPRTVETHKYEMMQRLHVQTNADLVRYAMQHAMT